MMPFPPLLVLPYEVPAGACAASHNLFADWAHHGRRSPSLLPICGDI